MSQEKNQRPEWAQMVREIPDYQTATGTLRDMMDDIISRNSPYNLDAMRTFGDDAQAARNAVAEEILSAQEGAGFEMLSEPLEKAAGLIGGMDLESLSSSLSTMATKGVTLVKRNPGTLAMAAAAAFLGAPVMGLVGGGLAIAAKEKAKKIRDKMKPETLEQIEERLRQGITAFRPMVAELEAARAGIPALRQNIQGMGEANMSALVRTTIYIGAGREIARRVAEEELPACADDAEKTELLTRSQQILASKLLIHEQSRSGAILDVTVMANLMKAVDDNDLAVESILASEIHNHRASLAAQKATADVVRFSRIINDFREKTEGDVKRMIKATDTARTVAAANRNDSPERMQAMLARMEQTKTLLEKATAALPAREAQKKALRVQLDGATAAVVDAQVSFSQAVANNNALPGAATTGNRLTGSTQKLTGPKSP